ncbi:hypothetical protein F5Y18DRAFT_403422 [Xylariaceae sp. FL1019]|nr:hypothetical protein F5Y18DRAFT_403422 [Xylariaceae sp. FL1019]
MVGVPGRSKGCSTCRRRKKGCDRARPVCGQCSNAGIECGGYQRERVFLNHNQDTESSSALVSYRKTLGSPPLLQSDTLLKSAHVELCICTFLNRYLPAYGQASVRSDSAAAFDFVEIAHQLHTSDQGIQQGLLSLSLCAQGQRNHGFEAYGRALRKLNTTLRSPGRVQSDSALILCKLLSLFEVYFGGLVPDNCTQSQNWENHLLGQLAILQARSPYDYQTGQSHALFTEGRYLFLLAAIKSRTRCPLNTPEWRTIPWRKHPKSNMQKLLDIIADLSEILADVDEMCNDDVTKTPERKGEIMGACWDIDLQLRVWYEEAKPLKVFRDDNDALYEPCGKDDVALSHMTVTYWTTYSLLYTTMYSLLDGPPGDYPESINPRGYLRKIALAIPYFWRPDIGTRGGQLAAFSLGLGLQVSFTSMHLFHEERALFKATVMQPSVESTIQFLDSLQKTTGTPDLAHIEGEEGRALRAQSWLSSRKTSPFRAP